MSEPLIYLASPYTAPTLQEEWRRYHHICSVAYALCANGHLIFCPIAQGHAIATAPTMGSRIIHTYWMKLSLRMLEGCQEMWVCTMPGWKESKGVQAEIAHAVDKRILVSYLDPVTLELFDEPPAV